MLIVGERINTSRKQVNEAVERRDSALIQTEVKAQIEAGANLIDVNTGSRLGSELRDLLWLIEVIQDAVSVRLSIDSSDPNCFKEALRKVRDLPMVNSTTAERNRLEKMGLVIQERECDVVGLCMDERGIPRTVDQILENARKLVKEFEGLGVKRERIYLDPIIQAVSTETTAGLMALQAMERIHREWKDVRTICGLSNISFSLPKRPLINRTFLSLAIGAGLSAAIVDPLDNKLMSTLRTTCLLLGQDPYCMTYLKVFREGKLVD